MKEQRIDHIRDIYIGRPMIKLFLILDLVDQKRPWSNKEPRLDWTKYV